MVISSISIFFRCRDAIVNLLIIQTIAQHLSLMKAVMSVVHHCRERVQNKPFLSCAYC